jgi:hypothetical protein
MRAKSGRGVERSKPVCFFFSLVPATAWFVIGFFVLFATTKAEGGLRTFGRVLGIWALLIGLMFPVMGMYLTLADACPFNEMMERMHSPGCP